MPRSGLAGWRRPRAFRALRLPSCAVGVCSVQPTVLVGGARIGKRSDMPGEVLAVHGLRWAERLTPASHEPDLTERYVHEVADCLVCGRSASSHAAASLLISAILTVPALLHMPARGEVLVRVNGENWRQSFSCEWVRRDHRTPRAHACASASGANSSRASSHFPPIPPHCVDPQVARPGRTNGKKREPQVSYRPAPTCPAHSRRVLLHGRRVARTGPRGSVDAHRPGVGAVHLREPVNKRDQSA